MAKKVTGKRASKGEKRKELEEKYRKAMGMLVITSPGSAAHTLAQLDSDTDLIDALDFIAQVIDDVNGGDLKAPEALLITQAYTLNALFHKEILAANRETRIDVRRHHADIAFRAQNQSLRNLKTLLEYKNPKRATFIKQQNNAVNQQINQGEQPQEISEKTDSANELLEVNHDARLDPGAPQEAVGSNQKMEALEEIDRTGHGTG